MKVLRNCSLLVSLLLLGEPAMAQWGNPNAREKADVLGRDLSLSALFLDQHDGVFWEYTTGNPDDENNSILIEMLGSPTNAIVTNSVQNFMDVTGPFRGAFRTRNQILTRTQRASIVQTMRDMETRSPAIGYVSSPFFNQYLYWTDRNSNGRLDLDDIDNMRSDAVVEFAYTFRGFPIVGNGLVRTTIINDPFVFQYLASLTSGISQTGVLLPSDQLQMMTPATVAAPELTIYDANGAPLASGAASSMTAISAIVTDIYSGPGRLEVWLGEPQTGSLVAVNNEDWDSITHTYTSSDSGLSGMGSLADGQYTVRAVDQAGNTASSGFKIDTSGSSPGAGPGSGPSTSTAPLTNNQCIVLKSSNTISGICKIWSEFSSSTAVFTGGTSEGTYALSKCGVSTGTYVVYAQTCAGVVSSTTVVISSAPVQETLAGSGAGWSASNSVAVGGMSTLQAYFLAVADTTSCDIFSANVNGTELTCQPQCGGCAVEYAWSSGPPAQTFNWTIRNKTSSTTYTSAITISGGVNGYNNQITFNAAPHPYQLSPGASIGGSATIPEVSNATYTYIVIGSTLSVASPYAGVTLSTRAALTGAEESARLRQVLRRSGYIVDILADGGAAVFNSTMTLRLEYADADIDTTTARIYRLSGTAWESNSMFSQTFSRSGNDVTAVGLSTFTSTFVVFFDGQDSSAPVTTFAIQGSSFVFDQALFVSTDAFVVLTATDPAVNGYASTVASITYRLDPSSGSPFYIYSSSIPLPLGTHVLEYRSLDYAGNTETVKTATFTVTAGAAMRASSTAQVPGVLLNGFLGSGAKLEIESQAENSLTLLISSANREGMVAVDNIGEVGIGVTPQANLNIGQSSIALQLRSGNSTSAVTSSQIALAYNGDNSMRHLLRTEHSTATHGNKLDFLVWNTGAASTTTVAALNVLSLQGIATASGGSFHVQPVGEPDAEVEVSNGLSTGGGTMQRLQVVSPSSRRFKTDIKDLRAKDEDRALADVALLKHARFRYKIRRKDGRLIEDPAQALHTGLIYEEAPDSIREGGEALSTTERLVNVELALKASMRRLEELQARYERLKAKRRNP